MDCRRAAILNIVFNFLTIFCRWLSEIYKKKRKMRFYRYCFKSLKYVVISLTTLRYTLSLTYWQHTMAKGLTKWRNNVYILLLLITFWKRVYFIYPLFEKVYFDLSPAWKKFLQEHNGHNGRCCSFVKLLCLHFCYFWLLNQG